MLGQALLGGIPLVAFVLPFIDRAIPADRRGRWVSWLGIVALASLVALTLWGWLS